MSTPIEVLGLTVKTRTAIQSNGLRTVEDLIADVARHGLRSILRLPNIGGKDAIEVAECLATYLSKSGRKQVMEKSGAGENGVQLRDYFAAKAMQGLLANGDADEDVDDWDWPEAVASNAYAMADAMLRTREAS